MLTIAAISTSTVVYYYFGNSSTITNIGQITSSESSNRAISSVTRPQLPSCDSNTTFFSVLPISRNDTFSIVPLGEESPPDHIFPAAHTYIYIINPQNPTDKHASVYSPGDLTLVQLGIRHYNRFGNV